LIAQSAISEYSGGDIWIPEKGTFIGTFLDKYLQIEKYPIISGSIFEKALTKRAA
jgi:hypothetical protein